ncbi:hypothetical protein [Sphingomonas sp. UYP23]
MRIGSLVTCLAVVGAPVNAALNDIPMVAIGLPFTPESPRPVAENHVLYHHVEVAEIEGLPATIGSSSLNFIHAAKRSSVNAALRETFERMNLLAPANDKAHVRLLVTWEGNKTPFHIGSQSTKPLRGIGVGGEVAPLR